TTCRPALGGYRPEKTVRGAMTMANLNPSPRAVEAVQRLEEAYRAYMAALQETLHLGEESIPALVAALKHKHANPIAKALGSLMGAPSAEAAIPRLIDWVIGQSPVYPDAVEALVRAGPKALPFVLAALQHFTQEGDDE